MPVVDIDLFLGFVLAPVIFTLIPEGRAMERLDAEYTAGAPAGRRR